MKKPKNLGADVLVIVGFSSLLYGIYLYGGPPPAFIVGGLGALAAGIKVHRT